MFIFLFSFFPNADNEYLAVVMTLKVCLSNNVYER